MTVQQVLDYLRNMHNEINALSPNWSDAELFALIQNRCNEAAVLFGLIEGTSTSTSTAGTADVSYPTNFIKIRRVRYNGVGLKYITFRQFESRRPTGTSVQGTPREWTQWDGTITLYPTPSASSDTITIYGEKKQSSITSTSSTIDIPEEFHYAICDGVLADMFAKDLDANFANMYLGRWTNQHLPAMREYVSRRNRIGSPTVVQDSDSLVETELGLI